MIETDLAFDAAWVERRTRDVAESLRQFVDSVSVHEAQRALLHRALIGARTNAAAPGTTLASVHLPLLVVAAIRRDDVQATGIARVTTLIETGVDLLDHIADDELGAEWQGRARAGAQLAATGFLCALPQLAIDDLAIAPDRVMLLHATLARAFVAMGAGQQLDLMLAGAADPTPEALDEATAGKTGARRGLYAHLAAIFAGAQDAAADGWRRFGVDVGMARQLASDAADVLREDLGRDLVRGLRTWPVAWALSRLAGAERKAFHQTLERARTDAAAREDVRSSLRTNGAIVRAALEVERYKARALTTLRGLAPLEPAGAALRSLVATV